jgi:hypothetical protein
MGINKRGCFTRDIFDAVTLEVRLRLWDAPFNVRSDPTVLSEQHIVFLIRACCCFAHRADRGRTSPPTSLRCLAHSLFVRIVRHVSKQRHVRAFLSQGHDASWSVFTLQIMLTTELFDNFREAGSRQIVSTGLHRL